MTIQYISDDGKIFYDEYECLEYEKELRLEKIKNVKFFDENGRYIDISHTICYAFMNFKKVIIPTVEDYEALVDILEDAGYDSDYIPSEGTWYEVYDDTEGNNTIISEEKLIMLTNSMENLLTIGE